MNQIDIEKNSLINTIKYKDNEITSRSMLHSDYEIISNYSNSDLKDKILNINIVDINDSEDNSGYYLLANNPNNFYNSSKFFNTLDNKVYDTISIDNKENNTYIRLTFDINQNYRIISGDGTYSNPYIMEGGAS